MTFMPKINLLLLLRSKYKNQKHFYNTKTNMQNLVVLFVLLLLRRSLYVILAILEIAV